MSKMIPDFVIKEFSNKFSYLNPAQALDILTYFAGLKDRNFKEHIFYEKVNELIITDTITRKVLEDAENGVPVLIIIEVPEELMRLKAENSSAYIQGYIESTGIKLTPQLPIVATMFMHKGQQKIDFMNSLVELARKEERAFDLDKQSVSKSRIIQLIRKLENNEDDNIDRT